MTIEQLSFGHDIAVTAIDAGAAFTTVALSPLVEFAEVVHGQDMCTVELSPHTVIKDFCT